MQAMPTLNRFPLLGLWAKEAARRVGYGIPDAEALGHAYAILYAIRKQRVVHPPTEKPPQTKASPTKRPTKQLEFAGDSLPVTETKGRLHGLVGGGLQTAQSYRASVKDKFPAGWYQKLQTAFRLLLKHYPPSQLDSRLVYDLYDHWKRACASGARVDLEQLVRWMHEQASERASEA